MLEIILQMFAIIFVVLILFLSENYIRSVLPGQNRAYILQPIYRVIKLFTQKDQINRPFTCWFPVGSCLFAIITFYLVVSGGNFLFILSGLIMMELFILAGACSAKEQNGIMAAQRGIVRFLVWSFTGLLVAASLYRMTGTLELSSVIEHTDGKFLIQELPFTFIALFVVSLMKGNLNYFNFGIGLNEKSLSILNTGLYTPYSGWGLAVMQFAFWLETGIWLKLISIFLPFHPWLSFLIASILYLAAMVLDGFIPEMPWKKAASNAWIWAGCLSVINYIWLYL